MLLIPLFQLPKTDAEPKTSPTEIVRIVILSPLSFSRLTVALPEIIIPSVPFLYSSQPFDKKIGFGQGKTKKAAEQKAAYEAILYLRKNQD